MSTNPTPNTPSREAMDAAKAICPHEAANTSQGTNRMHLHHVASIIDAAFAPLRAELARLRNVPAPTDDAKGTPISNKAASRDYAPLSVPLEIAQQLESALTQSREEVARLKEQLLVHEKYAKDAFDACQIVKELRATVAALQRDKALRPVLQELVDNYANEEDPRWIAANAALSTPKPEGTP